MWFNKACDRADWEHPDIARIMTACLGLPEDIAERKERKHWEWAISLLALERYGYLDHAKTALGLGCGHELVMFSLANLMGKVVATDLYGETPFHALEASVDVLSDPARFCPFPYATDRLEVRKMDARAIDFPDEHFDVVFSFSSLEHFGADRDVVTAMREAHRVLRTGGIYVMSVDYIYREPWPALPRRLRWRGAGEYLTEREVRRLLLDRAGFRIDQEIRFEVAETMNSNLYDVLRKRSLGKSLYPCTHLLYQIPGFRRYLFTSLSLVLFKGAPPALRHGAPQRGRQD